MSRTEPQEMAMFLARFSDKALIHSDRPIKLKGGRESNWYIDGRAGFAEGSLLRKAAELMINRAASVGAKYDIVAGEGVGGTALSSAIGVLKPSCDITTINNNQAMGQRYGYGLHGAKVVGKKVFEVDDTATSGDSLITAISMVRQGGGKVEYAATLCDRSEGAAAAQLGEIGIKFFSVFEFIEEKGMLVPSPDL